MFLIAGVSPKIKILDKNPKICPVCGLSRAYYKRVDHYFNLFFIPILRVKKGEPFIMCDRCERTVHEFKEEYGHPANRKDAMCHHCGKDLDKNFKYCPYCGKRL
jgi:RNA polymerase subunit RPABC4/transcription elongation factor Spt4